MVSEGRQCERSDTLERGIDFGLELGANLEGGGDGSGRDVACALQPAADVGPESP